MAVALTEIKLTRLAVEINAAVARICLHNPPLNVIDIQMMEELAWALGEIEARSDVSVVVLSGEGKAFSAGVDVAAHTPDNVAAMLVKFHAVIRALVASKKVTIALVHGHCLGGGAELGDGLRHGLYHGFGSSGDSPRSSWDAIRRQRALLLLPS